MGLICNASDMKGSWPELPELAQVLEELAGLEENSPRGRKGC